PLRERPEDSRVLAKYLLRNISNRTGNRVIDFEQDVLDFFLHYEWPGNVRELENVVESAVHLTNSEMVAMNDLPDHMQPEIVFDHRSNRLKDILEKAEIKAIRNVLKKADGDKIKAAALLGIGKSSFYEKIKKYGL